ncbi:MAG: DUF1622 domain-containing protein [Pseudomonadales bacterium]
MLETLLHIAIRILEVIGALVIVAAAGVALIDLGRAALGRGRRQVVEWVRLEFAKRLVLALEFLIAADILATLHTPTLEGIALLAATIGLRTILSLSIAWEIRLATPPAVQSRGDPEP